MQGGTCLNPWIRLHESDAAATLYHTGSGKLLVFEAEYAAAVVAIVSSLSTANMQTHPLRSEHPELVSFLHKHHFIY